VEKNCKGSLLPTDHAAFDLANETIHLPKTNDITHVQIATLEEVSTVKVTETTTTAAQKRVPGCRNKKSKNLSIFLPHAPCIEEPGATKLKEQTQRASKGIKTAPPL
jgi:hypothetical protein